MIVDNAGWTRSQALYSEGVDGLLVEQCMFDRNGWRPDLGRDSTAGIFAHNVYLQRGPDGDIVFRDNFTARASSHGIQARNGGDIVGNVFWQNPISILYGNEGIRDVETPASGDVDDNVVLEGVDMNTDAPRGWGVQIQNAGGVSFSRNIIANSRVDGGYGLMLFTSKPADNEDLLVADNVIDDFGRGMRVDTDDVTSVTVRGNTFTRSQGNSPLIDQRGESTPGLDYAGNRYFHSALDREFELDRSQIDLVEWQADFDPMGGALLPGAGAADPYVNGSATLETYARSIGYPNVDSFIEAMRQQRKGDWDPRLTPAAVRAYFQRAFTVRE